MADAIFFGRVVPSDRPSLSELSLEINNFGIMRTVTAYVMQVDTKRKFARIRQYHRFCGEVKYT